jgi:hypothetical protein
MQPKNSSNPKGPPPPPDLIEAAEEAESEVEMDLMEKLGPVMEAMSPAERKALEAASLALASKIVGEAIARDQAMQAFAVALTALNAYRESTGEGPIDPESVNPMMLASMLEELMQDQDFMEFIAGEVEVEEDVMDEDMMEDADSMVETPESMMNRRNTLMGAM